MYSPYMIEDLATARRTELLAAAAQARQAREARRARASRRDAATPRRTRTGWWTVTRAVRARLG